MLNFKKQKNHSEKIKVFTEAVFDTLVFGSPEADKYYGKSAAQNRWDDNMGWKEGRILIGKEVYDFCKNSPHAVIKISLRRKNSSHGTSQAVKPAVSGTVFEAGATRGQWTSDAVVPFSAFSDNRAEIRLYNGIQGAEGYAIWDGIRITVIKGE